MALFGNTRGSMFKPTAMPGQPVQARLPQQPGRMPTTPISSIYNNTVGGGAGLPRSNGPGFNLPGAGLRNGFTPRTNPGVGGVAPAAQGTTMPLKPGASPNGFFDGFKDWWDEVFKDPANPHWPDDPKDDTKDTKPPPTNRNPYPPGTPEYDLWKQYNTENGANLKGVSNEAFRQMLAAGMYNPGGSQPMISALRGQAVGDADALRARSNTISSLSGMDPAQAASSYFQRDMGSQGEVQRMLLNARLQSMTANQARLQGLAGAGQDAEYQAWLRGFAQKTDQP
jgi:hypothetical protein